MLPGFKLAALIVAFTVASGIFDSLAFSYAAGIWREGRLIASEAWKAAGSFAVGIALYILALRYLSEAGVVFAEIQVLLWFGVTIVGVAILQGRFFHWQVLEQVVAINVLLGLGWLISRTAT